MPPPTSARGLLLFLSSFSCPALRSLPTPQATHTPHAEADAATCPHGPPPSLLQLLVPPFLPHGLPWPLETRRPPRGRLEVLGLTDGG